MMCIYMLSLASQHFVHSYYKLTSACACDRSDLLTTSEINTTKPSKVTCRRTVLLMIFSLHELSVQSNNTRTALFRSPEAYFDIENSQFII